MSILLIVSTYILFAYNRITLLVKLMFPYKQLGPKTCKTCHIYAATISIYMASLIMLKMIVTNIKTLITN